MALALGTLGLSLTLFRDRKFVEIYGSALEIVALLAAFQQWLATGAANPRWILARTKAELLRQWSFLSTLFEAAAHPTPDAAKSAFDVRAAEIGERVTIGTPRGWWQRFMALFQSHPHTPSAVDNLVAAYWASERERYKALPGDAMPTQIEAASYLRRRSVRQLAWFRLAQERLQAGAHRRESVMASLFGLSVVLAICKACLILATGGIPERERVPGPTLVDFIAFGLLCVTALSAALTTLYLSRNDRSLFHRYSAQERRIEHWRLQLLGRADGGHPSKLEQALSDGSFRLAALDFEGLMIDELVDWIRISSRDALELAV